MELLHVEKYPGNNGETFNIRVFDNDSYFEAVIHLMLIDDGQEREINVHRKEYRTDTPLSEIVENCKKTIRAITMRIG
jgi:hypothetical protein